MKFYGMNPSCPSGASLASVDVRVLPWKAADTHVKKTMVEGASFTTNAGVALEQAGFASCAEEQGLFLIVEKAATTGDSISSERAHGQTRCSKEQISFPASR